MKFDRSTAAGGQGAPRRWGTRASLLLMAAATALPTVGFAALRQAPADPSPATGDAKVIAQGVVPIEPSDLVWQVGRAVAQTPANAAALDALAGFILADDGAILVEGVGASQVRLAAGEAALTRAGDRQTRAALGPNATDYWTIELLPANGAEATSAGEPTFTGTAFDGPGNRHDLDLVGATLDAGEVVEVPAGAAPSLVLVVAGSAQVDTADGESVALGEGEAFSVAGGLTLTGLEGGAEVAVAVVGPAVPRLRAADADADATPAAAETPGETEEAQAVSTIAAPEAAETPVAEEPPAAEEAPAVVSDAPAVSEDVDADGDGDGLSLAIEQELNTDPAVVDTDGDGLTDGDEINIYGTAPLVVDTDGDGIGDADEIATGGDPLTAAAPVAEAPAPPVAAQSSEPVVGADSDGDGLTDEFEIQLGTDPFVLDTDADGLSDADEYNAYQTGVLNPDSDGDGVLDGTEAANGTNPNDPTSF